MDSQVTLIGFEPPEYHEMEFLTAIEPAMRAAVEKVGGPMEWLSVTPTDSYTGVKFGKLTAFRLRIRGKRHYISVPLSLADLIPSDVPSKVPTKDEKYYKVLITNDHPLDSYKNFLLDIVSETVNRYPKEWDCCSRYLECSDAKICTHPDKAFAIVCGYRKILSSGCIFFGANRNIDA